MNREFKFRAWDSINSEMVYPTYSKSMFGYSPTNSQILKRFETIMQYIGADDKNQKEIYEGDIRREEIENDEGDEVHYYVCVWIKEWTMFAWLHLPDEYKNYLDNGAEHLDTTMYWTYPAGSDDEVNRIVICGNIFQNPELIKP